MFSYVQNSYLFLPLNWSQWFQRLSSTEHVFCKTCSVVFSSVMWHMSHRMTQICTQALRTVVQLRTTYTAACACAAVVGLFWRTAAAMHKWVLQLKKLPCKFRCMPDSVWGGDFDHCKHYLSNTLLFLQLKLAKSAQITHMHLFTASQPHVRVWIHIV